MTRSKETSPDGIDANGVKETDIYDVPSSVRRSGRARKPITTYDDDARDDGGYEPSPRPKRVKLTTKALESWKVTTSTRRSAGDAAAQDVALFDDTDIMTESLAPMTTHETGEWDTWIELESEPSFFNAILKEIGVKDTKIQELFSLDEDSLSNLCAPVHGLIFLYQYFDEEREEGRVNCPDHVWFANQTTDNACATVALLNIIMNAEGVELGEKLREFKAATKDLSPAIRGHLLSKNTFLQATHNSFARRIDLLNAALFLENQYDSSKKRPVKGRAIGGSRGKKKKPDSNAAYHFTAYVPVAGKIWELDGLETKPLCLAPYETDWTSIVRPLIEARMQEYEAYQPASFNLLALCRHPLPHLRDKLASAYHWALELRLLCAADLRAKLALPHEDSLLATLRASSPAFDLTADDIAAAPPASCLPPLGQFKELLNSDVGADDPDHLAAARDIAEKGRAYRAELERDWVREEGALGEEEARVAGRKKDMSLLIHEWLKKLAGQGHLEGISHSILERDA